MLAHFESELWSLFVNTKNRNNHNIEDFRWDRSVLDQKWLKFDQNYKADLSININNFEQSIYKIPRNKLDEIMQLECEEKALNLESVRMYNGDKEIRNVNSVLYSGYDYETQLMIYFFKRDRKVANVINNTKTQGLCKKRNKIYFYFLSFTIFNSLLNTVLIIFDHFVFEALGTW